MAIDFDKFFTPKVLELFTRATGVTPDVESTKKFLEVANDAPLTDDELDGFNTL